MCLACLLHGQPFLYSQGLTVSSLFSETCDVSEDNSVLVIGDSDTNATSIFLNNGTYFQPRSSIPALESAVELVDITDDGKWILVVELNGRIRLINYQKETNTKAVHDLPFSPTNKTEAGAISDDHQCLFVGDHDGQVSIIHFNSTALTFSLSQTLQGDGPIDHISLTPDRQFLAFSTLGQKVYIFIRREGQDQYAELQTLEFANEAERKVILTNDH